MTTRNEKTRDPGTRRKGKAAVLVVAIVLVMILTIFVGYNLWHVQTMQQERHTGTERKGLIGD